MKHISTLVFLLTALCSSAQFTTNFFPLDPGIQTPGPFSCSGTGFRFINDSSTTASASAWHPTTLDFDTCFEIDFEVLFGNVGRADGITFTIHDDNRRFQALGGTGGRLGVYQEGTAASISPSINAEIDIFDNQNNSELIQDHFAISYNGNIGSPKVGPTALALSDSTWCHVKVIWDGKKIQYYVDGNLIGEVSRNSVKSVFSGLPHDAIFGFTASCASQRTSTDVCFISLEKRLCCISPNIDLPNFVELECGESVTLEADPGYISYNWSTGSTTNQTTVTEGGTYKVVRLDQDSNETIQEFMVESNCCRVCPGDLSYEKEFYSTKYDIITQGMIQVLNNDFIIVGSCYNKDKQSGQVVKDKGFSLLRVDTMGNVIWDTAYTMEDVSKFLHTAGVGVYEELRMKVNDIRYVDEHNIYISLDIIDSLERSFGAIAHVNVDGKLNSFKAYKKDSICFSTANSIEPVKDAGTAADAVLVTGTYFNLNTGQTEYAYYKLDLPNQITWDKRISHMGGHSLWHGNAVESCRVTDPATGNQIGHIIVGRIQYRDWGNFKDSIDLIRTDMSGNVLYIKRFGVPLQSNGLFGYYRSDVRLIQSNSGVNKDTIEFILMYSTEDGIVNLLKLDDQLDRIWSYNYSGRNYPTLYAFDLKSKGDNYQVLTTDGTGTAMLFEVNSQGIPLDSFFHRTETKFNPIPWTQTIDNGNTSYNPRLLQFGPSLFSSGTSDDHGVSFVRWDTSLMTTCSTTDSLAYAANNENIHVVPTSLYTVLDANFDQYNVEAKNRALRVDENCCENNEFNGYKTICESEVEFDYEVYCFPLSIVITDVDFSENVTPGESYEWFINGTSVTTTQLPLFSITTPGSYEVCLKVFFTDNNVTCEKLLCKTIVVQPNEVDICDITWDYDYETSCYPENSITITGIDAPGSENGTLTYSWIVDEGSANEQTATGATPTFTNLSDGNHEVCVTIRYEDSCDYCERKICKTISTILTEDTTCNLDIEYEYDISCDPTGVVITNVTVQGSGTNTFEWFLNGILKATGDNPGFIPSDGGVDTLCLKIRHYESCTYCDTMLCDTIDLDTSRCTFVADFTYDAPCGEDSIIVTSVNITGATGTVTTNWTLDGVAFTPTGLPELGNLSPGVHELCLTILVVDNCHVCDTTICKSIRVGVEYATDTVETCGTHAWYEAEGCDDGLGWYVLQFPDGSTYNSKTNPVYNPNQVLGCDYGWIHHHLPIGTYTYNLYDSNDCLRKVLTVHIVPKPPTVYIMDLILCVDDDPPCVTVDLNDPTFPCIPDGSNPPTATASASTIIWQSPTVVSFCYNPGSFQITVIDSNGCECIVQGNIYSFYCNPGAPPAEEGPDNGASSDKLLLSEKLDPAVIPNPTSGKITVYFPGEILQDAAVQVITSEGKTILTRPLCKKTSFDLSSYAQGIYFIRIDNGGQKTYMEKIVLK